MTKQSGSIRGILGRECGFKILPFESRRMVNQPSTRKKSLLLLVFTIIGLGFQAACISQDSTPTFDTVGVGEMASISSKTVCAPTASALKRLLEASSEDEFLRMTGIEARSAGWVGPVFLGPSDRVRVLQFDSIQVSRSRYSSVPVARVRVEEIDGSPAANGLKPNEREGWIIVKSIDRRR
jgi:hypothetical protein